jgi:DNA-directed RNA polymerase specialized sigma24 family protein/predicted nucleic acid-binding protein
MRELFTGYSKKTEEEVKDIWENALITFDTSVILNLYRYSESTRNTILKLITKFQDRVFLPYQVALEYNRNRFEVISEQDKSHNQFIERLKQIENDLNSKIKPPFLSNDLHKSLSKVFRKVEKEVTLSIEQFQLMLSEDKIFDEVSQIFENKILEKFTSEKLQQLFKEADLRYAKKIPPGFEDIKKEGDKKYGDFIVWTEIIEKAKSEKKSIILISDERKKDWLWNLKDGRTIGPRQELVEEIKEKANVSFHIYNSERFLNFGQNYLNEIVNKEAIEEIEGIKKYNNMKVDELANESNKIIENFHRTLENYLEKLSPLEADIIRLNIGHRDMKPMSIKEIAETFDMTPKKIKSIKEYALKKILKMEKGE